MKRPPTARPITGSNKATGYWMPYVLPKGNRFAGKPWRLLIDKVRNAPTLVGAVATTDPYGPSTATLQFPAVTLLDEPGEGDLWWLVGENDVEIHWFDVGTNQSIYQWEGTMLSFDYGENETGTSLTVSCQGAMLQLDNFLSKPAYPYQPLPYELEIANQFKGRPSLRLGGMFTEWPSWWTKVYDKPYWDKQALYRRPQGLSNGQRWTGLLTRNTGDFEPGLQHVGNLLGSMFTHRGQWTLMLDKGRRPVLRHRDRVETPINGTLVVDMLLPGVKFASLTKDHSQKVNAVFANGTTVKGITFNGMNVSPDGSRTWYEPYAARREIEPAVTSNLWFDKAMMRREVSISFSEGASEDEARLVAERHLGRYADAGLTGSLSLTVDPLVYPSTTATYPRQLVRAGQHIQVKNVFGRPEGVVFHITESTSTDEGTTLTVDSKYRDQLTTQEVIARGRDALTPTRLLSINSYAPTMNDLLFPWSYGLGSGYLPRGSKSLFDGMPQDMEFPWETWTRKRPPRDPVWKADYIRIGPASRDANNNWARKPSPKNTTFTAFSVRMSQAGDAKLLQIAAYDLNGNILKVPFHVSFYTVSGISYTAMPALTKEQATKHPPYKDGQRYPFFDGAFEQVNAIGGTPSSWTNNLPAAGLLAGWGNYYEKAGYWPGSSTVTGAQPTGLLSLTNPGLTWNLVGEGNRVNLQSTPEQNLKNDNAGVADIYVMIYCDAQAAREVYFLGRIFRSETTAR